MADRRLRYPLLWLGFIAFMVVGAGLMMSQDGRKQDIGLWMLAGPLVVFTLLALVYYFLERRRKA